MAREALSRLENQLRRNRLPPIYDPATHWYQDWYFRLRIEEEALRCARYSYESSLVRFRVHQDLGGALSPARADFNAELTRIPLKSLRRCDIPGILGPQDFGICLPHTAPDKASIVTRRLEQALAAYRLTLSLVDLGDPELDLGDLLREVSFDLSGALGPG